MIRLARTSMPVILAVTRTSDHRRRIGAQAAETATIVVTGYSRDGRRALLQQFVADGGPTAEPFPRHPGEATQHRIRVGGGGPETVQIALMRPATTQLP